MLGGACFLTSLRCFFVFPFLFFYLLVGLILISGGCFIYVFFFFFKFVSCRECDGYTGLLNQISSSLVWGRKEAKPWAVNGPRTSLVPICPLKTPTRAGWHSQHRCLWAWNMDDVTNTWIVRVFSKTSLSRYKESGYQESHAYLFRRL